MNNLLRRPLRARRALTIIEMLISMTVSLIMIYAMIRFFGDLMTSVADGRASIEMSGQLRSATDRLHSDLRGVTVPVRPWVDPASGLGYFEYVENAGHDYQPLLFLNGTAPFPPDLSISAFGDFDDALAFTTRSSGRPFVGQFRQQQSGGIYSTFTTDSHYAEVIWWARWVDAASGIANVLEPGEVTVYRRLLLVRPDLAWNGVPGLVDEFTLPDPGSTDPAAWATVQTRLQEFYRYNDISVRPQITKSGGSITFRFWANSLADLTKRENRFCHRPILKYTSTTTVALVDDSMLAAQFPFPLNYRGDFPSLYTIVQTDDQEGEDVMLSHATAFDVKLFDPSAPLTGNHTDPTLVDELLAPSDPGYGAVSTVVSSGAYVDLFYKSYLAFNSKPTGMTSIFSDAPQPLGLYASGTAVYDTWPSHYEHDGVNQNGGSLVDEGTNGIDDNGVGGVDDPSERETQAPYNAPLRGIKVSLRMAETDSRQVKQMSVINEFTPE